NRHHVVRRPWRRSAQNQTARGSLHVQHDRGLHPRSREPSRRIRRGLPPLPTSLFGPSFGPSERQSQKNVMISVEAPGIEPNLAPSPKSSTSLVSSTRPITYGWASS